MVDAAFVTQPSFYVYFTFEGWMLSNLTAGMSPVTTLSDALCQVTLMGLFRFISLFYLNDWWRIIRTFARQKESAQTTIAAATMTTTDTATTTMETKCDNYGSTSTTTTTTTTQGDDPPSSVAVDKKSKEEKNE